MKSVLAMTLFLMSSLGFAQDGWEAVAETDNCKENVKILAKAGEPYVVAVHGDKKINLPGTNTKIYAVDSRESAIFKNDNYQYHHPSLVEASNPKIDIKKNGTNIHCNMKAVKK